MAEGGVSELPSTGQPRTEGSTRRPVAAKKFNVGEGIIQTLRWHMKQHLKRCGFVEQMVQIDDATTIHCHVPKAWVHIRNPKHAKFASARSFLKRPSRRNSVSLRAVPLPQQNPTLTSADPKETVPTPPLPDNDSATKEETVESLETVGGGKDAATGKGGESGGQRVAGGERGGKRPVLLLLHAFGPEAMFHWDRQVGPLSRRFDVVMPDLVFFGKSTSTSKERSEVFQAHCVAKLMQHYGVDRFDVLGCSYGGFVTYRLAQLYPENIRKVILTGCPGPVVTWPDYKKIVEGLAVEDWIELLVPETIDAMRKGMSVTYYRPPSVPDFVLYGAMKVLFRTQLDEKKECVKALKDQLDHPENPIPRIHQETLLIWGEYDCAFPLYLGQRLADLLGENARLEVMKDLGHQPLVEKPKPFNRLVLNFLSDKGRGPTPTPSKRPEEASTKQTPTGGQNEQPPVSAPSMATA